MIDLIGLLFRIVLTCFLSYTQYNIGTELTFPNVGRFENVPKVYVPTLYLMYN